MPTPPDKPRERSVLVRWIISHPKTTAALCGLVLLAGATAVFNASANHRLQRRIAAIRATGEPITIDDLRALTPAIPDDRNMTLRLTEIGDQLTAPADDKGRDKLLCYFPQSRPLPPSGAPLSTEQLDAARWYLKTNAEQLSGIHKALELEEGCFKTVWVSPAISTVIPELPSLRNVGWALATEQQVAVQERDVPHSTRLIFDLLHLDDALRHETVLISLLVRMANRSLAMDRIERTVNLCGVDEPSLRLMETHLKRMESDINFHRALMVERVVFLDSLEWMRSGGRNAVMFISGSGGDALVGLWSYLPAVPALDAAVGLEVLTEFANGVDTPEARSIEHCMTIETRVSKLAWYGIMSRMFIPSLSRAVAIWVRQTASARTLRSALACERYRLATGQWPENLADLIPDYLDALPTDPFDGQPIRFERIEQGIKVWTIGEDMMDDGGDVGRLDGKPNRSPPDAGWILMDPNRRGRPAGNNGPP